MFLICLKITMIINIYLNIAFAQVTPDASAKVIEFNDSKYFKTILSEGCSEVDEGLPKYTKFRKENIRTLVLKNEMEISGRNLGVKEKVKVKVVKPNLAVGEFKKNKKLCSITIMSIVWYCDNHDPKHAASSEEKRRTSTKVNGCKGWSPN